MSAVAQVCTVHPERLSVLAFVGAAALAVAGLALLWCGLRYLAWWLWAMRTIWGRKGGGRRG